MVEGSGGTSVAELRMGLEGRLDVDMTPFPKF